MNLEDMKMTINKAIIILFLIFIFVLSGCVKHQSKYVCSDGSVVSDVSLCPKQVQNTGKEIKTEIPEAKQLSLDEIKSIVYQNIRKYVPQSTIGSFDDNEYFSNTRCGDYWYYPSKNADVSSNVITSIIRSCTNNEIYTPEEVCSITEGCPSGVDYIKTLQNGKVLIHDNKLEDISRDDYEIAFACQNSWIRVITQDFYGENAWPIYKNYDIDKNAMESMANEILSNCK